MATISAPFLGLQPPSEYAKCLPKLRPCVGRVCRMADGLLEAVRGLWLADPELGPKPLLAKLRAQQPDLGAGTKGVTAQQPLRERETGRESEHIERLRPRVLCIPVNTYRHYS